MPRKRGRKKTIKLPYWYSKGPLKQQIFELRNKTFNTLTTVFFNYGLALSDLGKFSFPGAKTKYPYYKFIYVILFEYYIKKINRQKTIKRLKGLIIFIIKVQKNRSEKETKEMRDMINMMKLFGAASREVTSEEALDDFVSEIIFVIDDLLL